MKTFPKFHKVLAIDNFYKKTAGKGGEHMSEKEKNIISKIAQAVPRMSEFDKGYLLGKAETLADNKEEKGEGVHEENHCSMDRTDS